MRKSGRNDVEILILDNASTDETRDVVKKYAEHKFLKYIKNDENIGADNNFKKAISLSSGKYVWIFGDDDLVFDDTILYLAQILDAPTAFGIVHLNS